MSTATARTRSVSSPTKRPARPPTKPPVKASVFVSEASAEDYVTAKARAHRGLPLTAVQNVAFGQWRLWREQSSKHECAGCRTAISVPRRMIVEQTGSSRVIEAYGQKWLHADRRYHALCMGCGRGSDGEMITRIRKAQLRSLGAANAV